MDLVNFIRTCKEEGNAAAIAKYFTDPNEQPFDHFPQNGGFVGSFRKIACVGDSLSSGELESLMDGKVGYHDFYEYSWGQYIAREAGCTVYNFSQGGMTAKVYCESFADSKNFWSEEYRAQAYIIAMGANDCRRVLEGDIEFGSIEDIDVEDYHNNKETFLGYYARIIQRYKEIQPKAKFFLMSLPRVNEVGEIKEIRDKHCEALYQLTEIFDNCYMLDFRKYAPVYDKDFYAVFGFGHLSSAGYQLTAWMVEAYIDYIIRHNMEDFKQIGFVGTPYYNENVKW